MSSQTLTFEESKHFSFEEIVRKVLTQGKTLTISISDDQEITIQLKPRLKPLPVLEGYVPEGWKEAIYD